MSTLLSSARWSVHGRFHPFKLDLINKNGTVIQLRLNAWSNISQIQRAISTR